MIHAEWDKERIKVYWDAKRSVAISFLGFIFSLFLTATVILNTIVQTNEPFSLVWWGAFALEPVVFAVFGSSLLRTRKSLGETTLKTLGLMDKAEKGIPIDEELRKPAEEQGGGEEKKEGEIRIRPKTNHESGIEREEKRSILVVGLLGVVVAILVAIRPTNLTGLLWALFFVYVTIFLGGYLLCMLVYVSDDLWSHRVRLAFKKVGLIFLYAYGFAIVPFMLGLAGNLLLGNTMGDWIGWVSVALAFLVIFGMVWKIMRLKTD